MKNNRIIPLLLVIVLLVSLLGVTASADVVTKGTCGPNLKWEVSDRTLTISGTGAMDDFPYYDVGGPWHDCLTSFDHVVVKEDVTSIGARAFCHYPIQSVILPDSVTAIGKKAFDGCSNITTLVLGKGLTTIGEDAFSTCDGLTAIAFPDSVRSIGSGAFASCWGLRQIAVPDGITVLTNSVFHDTLVKEIYIPASVTTIEAFAFAFNKELTDVYFGGSQEQWNAITVDNRENRNDPLLNAMVHFNHQHNWDNGKTALSATCAQNGSKVYTCSVCNGTRSVSIPKTKSHTWDSGSIAAAATCIKEGSKTFTCTQCKETKSDALPKSAEHTWDKGKVNPDTTKTFTCTLCAKTKTEGTPVKETVPVTTEPETTPTVTVPAETIPETTESVTTAPTQPLPQENNAIAIGNSPTEQDPFPAGWIIGISLFCALAATCGIGVWFWQKKKR